MIDNSADKGYITVVVKKTGTEWTLCTSEIFKKPGEQSFYVDYENGTVFVNINGAKKVLGTYETTAGSSRVKVFAYPSKRVIGCVGSELIRFIKKPTDAALAQSAEKELCLAYYTQAGSITAIDSLLTLWGTMNGSEIGGAAAFVALFYNYNFKSVFRDFFSMGEQAFQAKYADYLK